MERIIVTLRDIGCRVNYDLELPLHLEMTKLIDDIVQTLNGYDLLARTGCDEMQLFSPRLNRCLADTETLDSARIWNGDYLELRPGLTR